MSIASLVMSSIAVRESNGVVDPPTVLHGYYRGVDTLYNRAYDPKVCTKPDGGANGPFWDATELYLTLEPNHMGYAVTMHHLWRSSEDARGSVVTGCSA